MTYPEQTGSEWVFPDISLAPAGQDFVITDGDLAPATLGAAYRAGFFPMHIKDENDKEILAWFSPDPRGILKLENFIVSRSLARSIKKFAVKYDQDFSEVLVGCANPSRAQGWINNEIKDAYQKLFELKLAHSVGVYNSNNELVGGLYGVEIGGLFAGESMFHTARDASKVALYWLIEKLKSKPGARLLDVQWQTPHLAGLGVHEVSRVEYLELLRVALKSEPAFG
ncbi:MAG: leucyl/phenylalanyl-tRNA--protein transferase [Candidatus Nanopelagicales bacterium]